VNIDVGSLTQLVFSVGVSWYLLATFAKKIEVLSVDIQNLSNSIANTQKESLNNTQEVNDIRIREDSKRIDEARSGSIGARTSISLSSLRARKHHR
jgi:hypothetical protein